MRNFIKRWELKWLRKETQAFFAHSLQLDLTQKHCLDAITAIACADAKLRPQNMHKRISGYKIVTNLEEKRAALFEIAKAAVQHDPAGTVSNLSMYLLTPTQEMEIKAMAFSQGTIEERIAKTIAIGKVNSLALKDNFPYFWSTVAPEEKDQAAKQIALTLFLNSPELTFSGFGAPMNKPINTPEGLKFWRWFALEVAKQDYDSACTLIELLELSPEEPEQKKLLNDMGIELIRVNPHCVLKNAHTFALTEEIISDHIKDLAAEPLATKEALLNDILRDKPETLYKCCDLILNPESEKELLKKLTIKLAKYTFSLVSTHHFDQETLKKLILEAVETATTQEAISMLKKIEMLHKLGLSIGEDLDYFGSLACAFAKKAPGTLDAFMGVFDPNEEKGFKTLCQIGLSLAALDGATFKDDAELLSFDPENEKHTNALKEMIQLAIAEDGDQGLEHFGELAPPPYTKVLSLKQACNLVTLFAKKQCVAPMMFLKYVPEEELKSSEGVAVLKKMIIRFASHDPDSAILLLQQLPETDQKQITLALLPQPYKSVESVAQLTQHFAEQGDEETVHKMLSTYATYTGLESLGKLLTIASHTYDKNSYFMICKSIVQLNPHKVADFKGSEEKMQVLWALATKKGTPQERLAAALEEASQNPSTILKNLSYYNLEDITSVLARQFSKNPSDLMMEFPNWVDWASVKDVVLQGAEQMSLKALLTWTDALLALHKKMAKEADPQFPCELAMILAAKSSWDLPLNKFNLTQDQHEAVIKVAYLENQTFTYHNLLILGVQADRIGPLQEILKKIQVEGSLQIRAEKAIEAIKRSPENFRTNYKYYFTADELKNKQFPEEVAQAYLNARPKKISHLIKFGMDGAQMVNILKKAAKESVNCNELLNYKKLKKHAKLSVKVPEQRKILFEIMLLIAETYPYDVLGNPAMYWVDLCNQGHVDFVISALKLATKKIPSYVFEQAPQYNWDFTKAGLVDGLIDLYKEIAKEKGVTEFHFDLHNWKQQRIKQAIYEEVPPAKYKGVQLY